MEKSVEKSSKLISIVLAISVINISLFLLIYFNYLICDLIGDGIFFIILLVNFFISIILFIFLNKRGKESRLASFGKGLLIFSWFLFLLTLMFYIARPFSMCGWYHMNYECSEIRIGIRDISSEDNSVTIQRMAGGSDVTLKDVKISVNGKEKLILSVVKYDNPSLLELETKTYVLDYDVQSGDRIQVAPIIDDKGDEMTCGIIASAKAP